MRIVLSRFLFLFVFLLSVWVPVAKAIPRSGEALVAATTGKAEARVYTGPMHEGRTEVVDLTEGTAVGETSRVMTGKDGRLCMVFSPGAIICVAPETEFTITRLRHSADGLPETEDDLKRYIHLDLHKGRVLVHAGIPSGSFDIRIKVDAGAIEANGGTFAVAQNNKEWLVFSEEYELELAGNEGQREKVAEGKNAVLSLDRNGKSEIRTDAALQDSPLRQFELCNVFFQDLEPFVHRITGFDRAGLGDYLGLTGPVTFLGYAGLVSDVSPSFRPTAATVAAPRMPKGPDTADGSRWNEDRIWGWWNDIGIVKGFNYISRNAVNSTEMWMEETFDEDIIDEELGWAQNAGYTSVRIPLQYVVWENDPDGMIERLDKFLDLASDHKLRVVPILFDDLNLAGTDPHFGPQPDPIPGKHNARWVPCPGPARVTDRAAWSNLENYVTAIVKEFRRDERILYWDLYNTAGNGDLWEKSLPLMDQTVQWTRDARPSQPLAIPVWRDFGSAMSSRKLERSDLITFHSFGSKEQVDAELLMLRRYNRPIICSDWLLRQQGNNFDNLLPVFAAHRVGWFNQGLVNGRTQMHLQQPQYQSKENPDLWQHDVFNEKGEAYQPHEIDLIQAFRYLEGP